LARTGTILIARTASASAIVLGVLFGAPARPEDLAPATAAFHRSDYELGLSDLELLGKRLFEDANLSEPAGVACASCHDRRRAYQGDNRSPIAGIARGSRPGQFASRKTPTITYARYSPPFGFVRRGDRLEARGGLFWDGRVDDLVAQPSAPLLNPAEMNNPDPETVVAKVAAAGYAPMMTAVFGPDAFAEPNAAFRRVAQALAAYERSPHLAPFTSRFDDHLRGAAALTPEETRGLALFLDPERGDCVACHAVKPQSKDPPDWLFTDFGYAALGVPRNPAIPANADPGHFDLGLCQRPGIEAILPKAIARASLCGAFKTPTLRNVAVRAPYFHNGAIASLRDAVAFHATRDGDPGRWYPTSPTGAIDRFDDLPSADRSNVDRADVPFERRPGAPPRLDDGDIDALVAFLETLTDKGMR